METLNSHATTSRVADRIFSPPSKNGLAQTLGSNRPSASPDAMRVAKLVMGRGSSALATNGRKGYYGLARTL